MKKFLPFYLFIALGSTMFLASCDDNETDPIPVVEPDPMNIVELAVATDDLSVLVQALGAADEDLVGVLSGTGPFTVLAPTNDAMVAFLADNGFASLSDVPSDVLTNILKNHVISGKVMSTDLASAGSGYTSTLGIGSGGRNLSLFFDTSNGVMFNGVSSVVTADLEVPNGVVHVIDAVIGLPTIVDHAVANDDFSSLVGALTADGNTTFTTLLSDNTQEFTVFAPNNAAFANFSNPNMNDLNSILANHVIAGAAVFSDAVSTGYVKTAAMIESPMNYIDMYISTMDGVKINGMSDVIAVDVVASNGVIHVVDEVIDLPSVVTFATADPTFETLVAALTREDLQTDFVSILSSFDMELAPFTVFAPTNDAFGGLVSELEITGLGDISTDVLTATLLSHLISGANVLSTDLTDAMEVSTLDAKHMTDLSDGAKLIDPNMREINIVLTDVQAANGVIHVIDGVLLPALN